MASLLTIPRELRDEIYRPLLEEAGTTRQGDKRVTIRLTSTARARLMDMFLIHPQITDEMPSMISQMVTQEVMLLFPLYGGEEDFQRFTHAVKAVNADILPGCSTLYVILNVRYGAFSRQHRVFAAEPMLNQYDGRSMKQYGLHGRMLAVLRDVLIDRGIKKIVVKWYREDLAPCSSTDSESTGVGTNSFTHYELARTLKSIPKLEFFAICAHVGKDLDWRATIYCYEKRQSNGNWVFAPSKQADELVDWRARPYHAQGKVKIPKAEMVADSRRKSSKWWSKLKHNRLTRWISRKVHVE
ncbi:hypothetical protein H2203_003856 [Taxawa tesnikishii (nom. ined.)]|nr:hypothetical protein H2203_003856 [Dothideales sp. JES 119]